MKRLVDGYVKFKTQEFDKLKHRFKFLADQQNPHTLFITCSDSRVVPDLITQTEPGELFICRVIGNLVPAYGSAMGGVSSAIEYAVMVLGVENIVVCGHSDCGAMRAFLHPEKLASLKAVSAWLEHANMAITMGCRRSQETKPFHKAGLTCSYSSHCSSRLWALSKAAP